jgi:predicted RNA-binding protein
MIGIPLRLSKKNTISKHWPGAKLGVEERSAEEERPEGTADRADSTVRKSIGLDCRRA